MVLHVGHHATVSLDDVIGVFNASPDADHRTGILLASGEWVTSDLAAGALVGRIARMHRLFNRPAGRFTVARGVHAE